MYLSSRAFDRGEISFAPNDVDYPKVLSVLRRFSKRSLSKRSHVFTSSKASRRYYSLEHGTISISFLPRIYLRYAFDRSKKKFGYSFVLIKDRETSERFSRVCARTYVRTYVRACVRACVRTRGRTLSTLRARLLIMERSRRHRLCSMENERSDHLRTLNYFSYRGKISLSDSQSHLYTLLSCIFLFISFAYE